MVGIFETDLRAGAWQKLEGDAGRTILLLLEDVEGAEGLAIGGGLLMLAVVGGSKVIVGLCRSDC